MAYTYTRTKTNVYIIGDALAATSDELGKAAAKMKETCGGTPTLIASSKGMLSLNRLG